MGAGVNQHGFGKGHPGTWKGICFGRSKSVGVLPIALSDRGTQVGDREWPLVGETSRSLLLPSSGLSLPHPPPSQLDNHGRRLLLSEEASLNIPAVAAAHVVKRYTAQAPDELSFEVRLLGSRLRLGSHFICTF